MNTSAVPIKRAVAILGALLLAGAAFIMALERPREPRRGETRSNREGRQAGRHVDPMRAVLARLELSDAERDKVRAVFAAHALAREDQGYARIDAARTLQQAMHRPEVDVAAVREASAGAAKAELAVQLERARIWAEAYAGLTEAKKQEASISVKRMQSRQQENLEDVGTGRSRRVRGGPFARQFLSLPLSDSQKAQVRDTLETRQAAALALRRADLAAHAAMTRAVFSASFDAAAVTAACREHAAAHENLNIHGADTFAALYRILDDAQRQRLDRRLEYAPGRRFR